MTILASAAIDSNTSALEKSSSIWIRGANMPTPRTDFTGSVLNGSVYIIGGFNNKGKTTDIIEFYDPKTDSWRTGPPLPEPLDHAAAATYNDILYVVGGYKNDRKPSETLYIYNLSSDNWQKGSPMPTGKGALTANFINGTLYAVGGVDVSGVSDSNFAYNPIADEWTEKKPMPTPREHLASAVVDGKLFVIGGRDWVAGGYQENFDVNEAYDPVKDNWIVLEPMPSKRGGLAAAASLPNGNIFVFGGEEPGATFNNNEMYDPLTDKWSKDIPVPTARHGLVSVAIDDKIYVVGGGIEPGLSVSGLNEIFLIDMGQKK